MFAGYIGLCGALVVYLLYMMKKWKQPLNLPPGPSYLELGFTLLRGWIANTPAYEILLSISKKYGPIFMTRLDEFNLVVLSDFEHVNEVLTHEHWGDRFGKDSTVQSTYGKYFGLFLIGGEVHREMRKFGVRTLRECGFGKSNVLGMSLHLEAKELTDRILTETNKTNGILEVKGVFSIAVLNMLWTVVTGKRLEYDDTEKIQEVIEVIFEGIREFPFAGPNAVTFHVGFPRLAKFFSFFSDKVKGVEFLRKHSVIQNFIREQLEETRALGEYKHSRRTYIDSFLQEIDLNSNGKGSALFTDDQFVAVTVELLIAGADTSKNTMESSILYMLLHPEIQSKVQAEIDNVIGTNRYPVAEDRKKMPFTAATILEIHRKAVIIPLYIRSPDTDTQIGKYFIPKNSMGMLNTFALHMDEKLWKNPYEFNPYRFLDCENNIINAGKFLPFGAGKRYCIGETVASATIFIFLTSLLQRFTFEISPEHPKPTTQHIPGITLSPHPFYALVKERSH